MGYLDFALEPMFSTSNSPGVLYGLLAALVVSALYLYDSRRRRSQQKLLAEANSKKLTGVLPDAEDVKMDDIRISRILVHPIKSCRGTSVTQAACSPTGLEYDRWWCVIDPDKRTVLTAREIPKLVLVHPTIEADPASPYGGKLVVNFPKDSGCETFEVPLRPTAEMLANWTVLDGLCMHAEFYMDGYICQSLSPSPILTPSSILSQFTGRRVQLMYKGPAPRASPPTYYHPNLAANVKYQDGYPLLVASEESLGEVSHVVREFATGEATRIVMDEKWREGEVEMERFRPNIVFNGAGVPFAEDIWSDIDVVDDADSSRIGISLVSKCTRCLLPNVDIHTGVRDKAVPFKVLMKFRTGIELADANKPCFGCNGVPSGSGIVKVGDRVEVRKWI